VAYVAVLDADVLNPYLPCYLLLELAERRLFRPVWSTEILDEFSESLGRRYEPEKVLRRRRHMEAMFPEAMVSGIARFLPIVPAEVDPGDRHVVAAALAGKADAIVTGNVRHFAGDVLARELDLDVQSLDGFLTNQWTLDPLAVGEAIEKISLSTTRPHIPAGELINGLRDRAPTFVATVLAG
jgi:predicted nucleic acid-binding protein